jgi:hypothetical protein
MEPPIGIEPMTYALRASPVLDGGQRSMSFRAGFCLAVLGWRRLVMDGRGHTRGTRPSRV